MRRVNALLILLVLAGCATAPAPKVSMCNDVKAEFINWRADLFAKNPTAQERPLDANETEVFISAYNATPPVSHLSAAHIAVYHVEGFPQMLVVWLDESSCVQNTSMIPVEHMKKLLKGYPVYPTNQKQT